MSERSKDRHSHRVSIGVPKPDWLELETILEGHDDDRSELVRKMIAAFLKRPGAKIPRRSDYEPPSGN